MRWLSSLVVALVLVALAAEAHAIIGMPWTPVSFAGAARRSVRRSAYVGAAAAGAAAAGAAYYGAAAAAAPYRYALPPGCVPGYPCGGVVYQPYYRGGNVVYVAP
jgi:hypothetical protein